MGGEKILVVEDEKDIVRLLRYNLEKEGYCVAACHDGEAALECFRKERPDLVILDLMIPKLDGIEVCKLLRQSSQVPILMLTAKKSEVDRILGLRIGADDYVTKPFSVGELLARVQALLRRAAHPVVNALRAGALEMDFERHELRLEGKPVSVTPKEFEFLRLLVQSDGKVLTREEILERVWGYDRSMDIDTRTVDQHIARLRRKLGAEGERILTVTNVGYRFRP
ncbi:MAG: response regulator transcription factor [Elusimicrobiota bacterium]